MGTFTLRGKRADYEAIRGMGEQEEDWRTVRGCMRGVLQGGQIMFLEVPGALIMT